MGIDLNGSEYNSPVVGIFNNGQAGKVNGVKVSVEKKGIADSDNAPAYKVLFTDEIGSINMGLFYPTEQSTDSQNKLLAGKCADLVKAVMGVDYVFPQYNSYNELLDGCMTILSQNAEGKLVNVFATYGTKGAPKKFLGVYKNFNFVEGADVKASALRQTINPNKEQYDDLMERIVEDQQPTQINESNVSSEPVWGARS
jgi:hypothetical protein